MVIKVCRCCRKMSNTGPSGMTSGWIDYTCNKCLGLPPGVPHPYPGYKKPTKKLRPSMISLLRNSVRVAA